MILKVFTVYDSKAEAYMQPFFMNSKGEALRSFQEACNDPKSTFSKYPSDFTLFEIGWYDDSIGEIGTNPSKIALGNAIEYKKDNKPVNSEEALQHIQYIKEKLG